MLECSFQQMKWSTERSLSFYALRLIKYFFFENLNALEFLENLPIFPTGLADLLIMMHDEVVMSAENLFTNHSTTTAL